MSYCKACKDKLCLECCEFPWECLELKSCNSCLEELEIAKKLWLKYLQGNLRKPQLYYTPPTDEQFNELKEKAIELWSTMGDEPSYSQEKIARIKDIKNVGDNFMYIVAMFDQNNQRLLSDKLENETRGAVAERIKDGGAPDYYNAFLSFIDKPLDKEEA